MKNNYMYTIRRHLGKGKHFGWWQIREYITNSKQGAIVEYVDPAKFTIIFRNCFLYNRPNTAKKIFNGGHKQPCAWICAGSYVKDNIEAAKIIDDMPTELEFNPKKAINWRVYYPFQMPTEVFGEVLYIYTKGTKLYI